jgi:hypothetical protein
MRIFVTLLPPLFSFAAVPTRSWLLSAKISPVNNNIGGESRENVMREQVEKGEED